jgi:hypothetical protein
MAQAAHIDMQEIIQQVTGLTQELLASGGRPEQVAFALATIAADMGFEVTGDPYQVIPVLMDAIAFQAKRRLQSDDEDEAENACEEDATDLAAVPCGTTVH